MCCLCPDRTVHCIPARGEIPGLRIYNGDDVTPFHRATESVLAYKGKQPSFLPHLTPSLGNCGLAKMQCRDSVVMSVEASVGRTVMEGVQQEQVQSVPRAV